MSPANSLPLSHLGSRYLEVNKSLPTFTQLEFRWCRLAWLKEPRDCLIQLPHLNSEKMKDPEKGGILLKVTRLVHGKVR